VHQYSLENQDTSNYLFRDLSEPNREIWGRSNLFEYWSHVKKKM